jgi:hypothetical protein
VISGGPLAVTAEITDTLLCEGGFTQLHALPSGGNPDYSYSWTSDPPGFTSILQEPVVSAVENTTFTVEVFDGFNYFSASVDLTISTLPVFDLGPDKTICPYDTVTLEVDLPGMEYYWSNGSIDPYITVGTTGIGFDFKELWVEVTNADGCMSTDTVRIIFDFAECSGVEEQHDDIFLHLYPNPTSGILQVEWKGLFGTVEVELSDLQGKPVFTKLIQSPPSGEYSGSISLENQQKGLYLVKFISGDQMLIRKVLLQ